MITLESLTQADLSEVMRSKSLSRAKGYLNRIREAGRFGSTLTAMVTGSSPYQVEIEVEGAIYARCSCPYNWGGYCKHIGAVLLKWLQSPGSFVETEPPPAPTDFPIRATPVEPPPTHRPSEEPFWLTSSLTDRQHVDREQLVTWLESHTIQDLRRLAKQRDWPISGTRKADIVTQMFEHMTDRTKILKTIRTLDNNHLRIFLAMVLLGNERRVQPPDVRRVAEIWGPLTGPEDIKTYLDYLYQQGLAMSGFGEYRDHQRLNFVPRVLIRHLPPLLSRTVPATPESTVEPANSQRQLAEPLDFVRAANQLIVMLEQNPVPLRPPLPKPHLAKFFPDLATWDYDPHEIRTAKEQGKFQARSDLTLTVPPPAPLLPDEAIERLAPLVGGKAKLEFIYALLVAAGLFQPGSPTTVWPEIRQQFLRRPELSQRSILARLYFQMTNWSELWPLLRVEKELQLRRLRNFTYSITPDRLRADLVSFRQIVLRFLACLPDDEWVAMDDLDKLLKAVWPRFDQTAVRPHTVYQISTGDSWPSWFLARRGSTQPLAPGEADWQLAQGNFIRHMITGPLHWLGLVDLNFKDDSLVEIRLHGLGDLYWDRLETPGVPHPAVYQPQARSTAPQETVTIDHQTIIVNPSAITAEAHTFLDKIARLEEITSDRFTYILSSQALHYSFEAGLTLDNIVEEWSHLLPVPMPESIRTQLADWWQAYGQLRIYEEVTVIEFSDDYTLTEIKAVTSLAQHLIAEISPRLVLIPEEAIEPLMIELEQAGYTPKQAAGV